MTETSSEKKGMPVILVVDDNPRNLQLVGGVLSETLVCDLCFATSGAEALDILGEMTPDLILLDVNMPGMSGFELCSVIRSGEATREVPVIFLTAQQDTHCILKGFSAGGNDYVIKPFEPQELQARVKAHLSLKLRTDELKDALARIKRLEGIIPICMYCKKIRDDGSIWLQMEQYISEHSDALFSHGVCPECFREQMSSLQSETTGFFSPRTGI
ncbi:MAG: response regulator [Desulfuromonadales bacterium]